MDVQFLADCACEVKLHALRVADQVRRDVNLHVVLADYAVWGEVFAFEVRVDRHVMLCASSTNRWDEVDCGDPTLLLDVTRRLRRQKEFHVSRNP